MTRERSRDMDGGQECPWLDSMRARHAADDKRVKGIGAVQVEQGRTAQTRGNSISDLLAERAVGGELASIDGE